MSEFTPGPWRIEEFNNTIWIHPLGKGRPIAIMNEKQQDYEANAPLIAAAPEMYEACKEVNEFMSDLSAHGNQTAIRISAILQIAIAKAEGN